MRSTSIETIAPPARFHLGQSRDFALLWTGSTLSQLGNAICQVTFMWWVLAVTGSTTAMATATTFMLIPMLIVGPLAGVYVDRLDRRRLLVAAKLFQGGLLVVPAALLAAGRLEVWHIYLVCAGLSLGQAFDQPAAGASLPNLVPPGALVRANSLMQLSVGLSGVIGPVLGGVAVAALGEARTMYLNALAFLLAGGSIALARWSSPSAGGGKRFPVLRDLVAGLAFIRTQIMLLSTVILTSVLNFAVAPLGLLLPVMARDVLGQGATGYGALGASAALGTVGGAIALGIKGDVRGKGRVVLAAVVAVGLLMAGFGLSRSLPVALAVLAMMGIFIGLVNVLLGAALQALIPDDRRGRILAALGTFNQGLRPLAVMLAGVLADRCPAPLILVCSGVLTVLAGGAAFLFPGTRDIP